MAYTELTCDDEGLSLETLYRMSMVDMGDGTYSQRVVEYAGFPFPYLTVESGDINATYLYYDDYLGKPRYVQVVDGLTQLESFDASNFFWWLGDNKWHIWGNGGGEYYTSTDDVATPNLATTWVVANGANAPLPIVTLYT